MIYELTIKENLKIGMIPFTKEFLDKNLTNYRTWFYDSEVTKYNSHGLFPYTKQAEEDFFSEIESGNRIVWAILSNYKKATHNVDLVAAPHIGNCSLQSINWINRSAEFAIVIGEKNYWGKGIGMQVLNVAIKHAFNKLNLYRVWTGTAASNKGMQRVALNNKMRYEGTFYGAMWLNGGYEDVYTYGIINEKDKHD